MTTWPHPDEAENRRLGASRFLCVHDDYFIEPNVRWSGGPPCSVLFGIGGRKDNWFAPFVHRELPGELAKLRDADDEAILSFARVYGQIGPFPGLVDVETVDPPTRKGPVWYGGDPLPWIRAHAWGTHICLAITDALTRKVPAGRMRQLLESFEGIAYGTLGKMGSVEIVLSELGRGNGEAMARVLRRQIINRNLKGVHRYLTADGKVDRSFFQADPMVSAVYWHLANVIDGGTVKRCEADGCGAYFIQMDARQRNCPKRWRQGESPCAMRQRQRDRRLQRLATEVTAGGVKTGQLPARSNKNARQPSRKVSRA